MRKIIFLSLLFTLSLFSVVQAQEYKTAVGMRLGYPLSASIKHFINETGALEGYIGTRGRYDYRWVNVGGAYQIHKPLEGVVDLDGLQWYYGFGASVYFWSWDDRYSFYEDRYSGTSFGVQGYIGLDYKFENIPLNVSLDWVPSVFINGFGSGFGAGFGAVAVRYVIGG